MTKTLNANITQAIIEILVTAHDTGNPVLSKEEVIQKAQSLYLNKGNKKSFSPSSCDKYFSELVIAGKITRPKNGYYSISPPISNQPVISQDTLNQYLTPEFQDILNELGSINQGLKDAIIKAEISKKSWYQWHSLHFYRSNIAEIRLHYNDLDISKWIPIVSQGHETQRQYKFQYFVNKNLKGYITLQVTKNGICQVYYSGGEEDDEYKVTLNTPDEFNELTYFIDGIFFQDFGFKFFNYDYSESDPFFILQMAFGYDIPCDKQLTHELIKLRKSDNPTFLNLHYHFLPKFMLESYLKLNPDKTSVIRIATHDNKIRIKLIHPQSIVVAFNNHVKRLTANIVLEDVLEQQKANFQLNSEMNSKLSRFNHDIENSISGYEENTEKVVGLQNNITDLTNENRSFKQEVRTAVTNLKSRDISTRQYFETLVKQSITGLEKRLHNNGPNGGLAFYSEIAEINANLSQFQSIFEDSLKTSLTQDDLLGLKQDLSDEFQQVQVLLQDQAQEFSNKEWQLKEDLSNDLGEIRTILQDQAQISSELEDRNNEGFKLFEDITLQNQNQNEMVQNELIVLSSGLNNFREKVENMLDGFQAHLEVLENQIEIQTSKEFEHKTDTDQKFLSILQEMASNQKKAEKKYQESEDKFQFVVNQILELKKENQTLKEKINQNPITRLKDQIVSRFKKDH